VPTLVLAGYQFRFYSSDRFEPPHMHVIRGENEAKVWLQPVRVESNHGYNGPELNAIVKLAEKYQARLLEVWNAYFSS
jgi:Domain of unknown function (DUF4160)